MNLDIYAGNVLLNQNVILRVKLRCNYVMRFLGMEWRFTYEKTNILLWIYFYNQISIAFEITYDGIHW